MGRPRGVAYRSVRPRKRIAAYPLFEQLREHRISQGLTQADLAFDTGYDATVIHKIEYGRTLPRWKTFFDLCDALGIEVKLEIKEKI
jgi:DNA-binding XRE family transcriptional regulator